MWQVSLTNYESSFDIHVNIGGEGEINRKLHIFAKKFINCDRNL